MTPDPQVQLILEWIRNANAPEYSELTPQQARTAFETAWAKLDARREDVFRAEDRRIPGPVEEIPVRIYTPAESASPLPVVVWLHGGGFVIGSLESYDAICRVLANHSGAIVVSVDYRLAPEHPFPAAVDDAFAALKWAAANASSYGGDAARIAVAGDSAGGNLAAVCAILARDAGGPQLARQVLIYPATAAHPDSASHLAYAEGYVLTRRTIQWFRHHKLGGRDPGDDFRHAPLLAPDLSGLAPALVIVAGFDPLHDEGVAYAKRLKDAGNTVDLLAFDGMVHGFLNFSRRVDAGRVAIGEVVKSLKKGFGLEP
jgi:acetyl esterase